MRKGQIEMIGLVIVVVLIVVGGLFYVKFMMLSDTNSPKTVYQEDSIKSNNLMGAIANVKLCDGNYAVGELFSKISGTCDDKSVDGGNVVCEGKSACIYLLGEIPKILDATGAKNYRFWVVEGSNTLFSLGECEYGVKSGSYALVVDNRYFKTHLRFCTESSTL